MSVIYVQHVAVIYNETTAMAANKMGIFVFAFFINQKYLKMSQFFIPLSDNIRFTGISICGIKVKS